MLIRKEWPDMPARNRRELEYLLRMLRTLMPHERVVLYGRYAGQESRNHVGGYELLLLTQDRPSKEGWELEAEIERLYPHELCAEPIIHIETASMEEVNRLETQHWFYTRVRDTGTILRNDDRMPAFFRAERVDWAARYGYYRPRYDHLFGTASQLLEEAERMWLESRPCLAFVDYSYACELLLRTMEAVYYGNHIHTSDLRVLFKRVRFFSPELATVFSLENIDMSHLLGELTSLRLEACLSCGPWDLSRYRFMRCWLQRMKQIVQRSCERHLFYLKHGKPKSQLEAEALRRPLRSVEPLSEEEPAPPTAAEACDRPAAAACEAL